MQFLIKAHDETGERLKERQLLQEDFSFYHKFSRSSQGEAALPTGIFLRQFLEEKQVLIKTSSSLLWEQDAGPAPRARGQMQPERRGARAVGAGPHCAWTGPRPWSCPGRATSRLRQRVDRTRRPFGQGSRRAAAASRRRALANGQEAAAGAVFAGRRPPMRRLSHSWKASR